MRLSWARNFKELLHLAATSPLCPLRQACSWCVQSLPPSQRTGNLTLIHFPSQELSGLRLPQWPLIIGKVTRRELWSLRLTFNCSHSLLHIHFPVKRWRQFFTSLLPFFSEKCSLTLGDSSAFGHLALSSCFIPSQNLSLLTKSHDSWIRMSDLTQKVSHFFLAMAAVLSEEKMWIWVLKPGWYWSLECLRGLET